MSTGQRDPTDPDFDPMDLFDGQRPWEQEPAGRASPPLELSWRAAHERHVLDRATRVYQQALRRQRRQRLRSTLRAGVFAGRTAALASILVIAGATAYGASALLGHSTNHGPARDWAAASTQIPVSSGHAGPDHWALKGWSRDGQLCTGLVVAEQEQTDCANPPAAKVVQALTLDSPTRRYLSGFTGTEVAGVKVRAGTVTVTVPSHPLARPAAARLPHDIRWFVVILQRGESNHDPRAHITALGANGQPLQHPKKHR